MSYQNIFRNFIITRRQFILSSFKLSLFGIIAARLGYLQLIKHDQFSLLSKQNCIATILVPPLRGEIFDRSGNKIAFNQQKFKLILSRPKSKQSTESLQKLTNILGLSEEELENIRRKILKKPFDTPIIENLSWEQIVLVEQSIFELDNVRIDSYFVRTYPYSDFLAHPLGYTAAATQNEVEKLDIKQVDNFMLGRSGVEKYYDQQLIGSFGFKQIEVDAHGRCVREIEFTPSQTGESLTLGIDCNLQLEVCKILGDLSGCAIVTDLKSGQILSMASTPNFQANNFIDGISKDYWQELHDDKKLPLLNKAIQATYPPGSIFKLVTVLAALEAGITPDTKVMCRAGGLIGDHFHCGNKNGHGMLPMEEALGRSCNYYMYHIVKNIGHRAIIDMATRLGLGQKVGIDMPWESPGFLPQSLNIFKNWQLPDSLNLSIGQGLITATPLQLNRLISIIALKGKIISYSLKQQNTKHTSHANINPEYFDIIHKSMWRSVNHPSGTSKSAAGSKMVVAGKTGTAQVISKKDPSIDLNADNVPWHQKNHALFACFAPFDDPKYSITVVIEHGGGGGRSAAPIAKKIIELL
jgi:penicillin-binding protein 2